jgi:hypothetical protein
MADAFTRIEQRILEIAGERTPPDATVLPLRARRSQT